MNAYKSNLTRKASSSPISLNLYHWLNKIALNIEEFIISFGSPEGIKRVLAETTQTFIYMIPVNKFEKSHKLICLSNSLIRT